MAGIVDFVDQEAIKRNTDWLLGRRNEEGGFDLNPRALDTFGRAAQDITDAYITWVLSYQDDFDKDSLKDQLDHLQ